MNYLAIDTSNASGSIAIANDKNVLFSSFFNIKITHSETLMPEIDRGLKLCKLEISDINAILIAEGPGSFTGLRIGLATAKGISYAHKIPIIPIDSLKIVAMNYYDCGKNIIVIQDAKMKEVYTAGYSANLEELYPPQCISPDKVHELIPENSIICGSGTPIYGNIFTDLEVSINSIREKNYAHAESMFSILNVSGIKPKYDFEKIAKLEPYYIRKSQAEISKKEKELHK